MSPARLFQEVVGLLFPARCQVCGELGDDLICKTCREGFEFIARPFCVYCGVPLEPGGERPSQCGQCRQGREFTGARAVGLHVGSLREAILRYKFDGRRRLAGPLAELLAEVYEAEREGGLPLSVARALVPVPLYPARRAWRGFDQAELLCRHLSEMTGLDSWPDVLARVRDTRPQVELSGRERRENVQGAFEARKTYRLEDKSLILVDDVFTTGATLSECARVLRKAGAAALYALTVSRTAPSWHPAALQSEPGDAQQAGR
jgi:ComF family protein